MLEKCDFFLKKCYFFKFQFFSNSNFKKFVKYLKSYRNYVNKDSLKFKN